MESGQESPVRRRAGRLVACAAAVGLGAGIVTGTGVASADVETDQNGNPPSNGNSAGIVGSTLGAASGVVNGIARVTRNLSAIPVVKTVDTVTTTLGRLASNHSLVTAR